MLFHFFLNVILCYFRALFFNKIFKSNLTMNKFSLLFIFSLFLGLISFAQSSTNKNEVKAENSRVMWTGYKAMGQHQGELSVKSGHLSFNDGIITGGELVVDMKSITCTDIEDATTNTKLVGHLKSADFFNVDSFAVAQIKIKKAVAYGEFDTKNDESTGEVYKITADLTIKDITEEIKFKMQLYKYTQSKDYVSAVSRITLDRTDFDIKYGSGSFFDNLGDKVIYDEFMLDVSVGGRIK